MGDIGFTNLGPITNQQTIASKDGIRQKRQLITRFGRGRWRKIKGVAMVQLASGRIVRAELHWYEAHGIGRVSMKIKRELL
jgi:hypothetical protein